MHRLASIILLVLSLIGPVFSQDPKSELAKAAEKFSALDSYAAVMRYEMNGHADTGQVYYQGLRYHFDYPEDQTIFDGNIVLNWNKEFALMSVALPEMGPSYTAGGIYFLHHQSNLRFEWEDGTGQNGQMRITSTDPAAQVKQLDLRIGRESGLIEAYTLHLLNGMRIDFKVLNMALNPALDEHLFEIDWEFVRKVRSGEVPPVEHHH